MRRTWLRGRQNVQKRYLIQVAAYNLGLVMRALLGAGTPKAAAARGGALLWLADATAGLAILIIVPPNTPPDPTSSTACSHVRGQAPGQGDGAPACTEVGGDGRNAWRAAGFRDGG
jgi:hypothetical protein